MGLVNPDIKPLSDEEMRDQLKWALKHFASEDLIESDGLIPFGRGGPNIQLRIPLRQLCELAKKGLDAQSYVHGEPMALLCEMVQNLPDVVLHPQAIVEKVGHDAYGNPGTIEFPKFQKTLDKVRAFLKKSIDTHACEGGV